MDSTLEKKMQGFQLIAQEKLQAILCSIPGNKDLILEQNLIKPLEHICAASWLKLKGVQRIYKFEPGNAIPHTESIQVIMLRITFQQIVSHISAIEQNRNYHIDTTLKQYHLVCVPSCFYYYRTLLEEEGLCGMVQLHCFNWDFILLDRGLLSLEMPNVFPTTFMRRDTSLLPAIAQSIRVLQMVCGCPNYMVTYGDQSANIVKMLNAFGPWKKQATNDDSIEFSAMVIVDRDRDFAASLLTPAIYSGLLLEVFNCNAGEINCETNKILSQTLPIFSPAQSESGQESTEKRTPTMRMNSMHDEIYGENRYKHFAQASGLVRAQAKAIGLEVQKLTEMKLDEMHDYVARKLPKITQLKAKLMRHLNLSETVIEMLGANFRKVQTLEEDILNNVSRRRSLAEIDEMLTVAGQRCNTLRLMCLLHLCTGVSGEELTIFVRNYCNYFGAQHLPVFQQLAAAGLLPHLLDEKVMNKSAKLLSSLPLPKFQQTEFQANANRLKLVVSSKADAEGSAAGKVPQKTPAPDHCPSYVFNGTYIPLVAQLCSLLLKFANAEEIAGKLGMLEKIQLHLYNNSYKSTAYTVKSFANAVKQGDCKDIFPAPDGRATIFVYIVGGATFAEIAACDLVSRTTGAQIVIASDSIIAGADLLAKSF